MIKLSAGTEADRFKPDAVIAEESLTERTGEMQDRLAPSESVVVQVQVAFVFTVNSNGHESEIDVGVADTTLTVTLWLFQLPS